METRKLTVSLTEKQFQALGGAVATECNVLDDEITKGNKWSVTHRKALMTAWEKIYNEWNK